MQTLLTVIIFPLMLLNLLGGIVGGVWLAWEGEWSTIGFGAIYLFIGGLVAIVLMAPGLAFVGLSVGVAHLRNKEVPGLLETLLVVPQLVWTYAVVTASCVVVFALCTVAMTDGLNAAFLLWGYAIATGPWSSLAARDGEVGSQIGAFFAQLGTVAMMIATYSHGGPLGIYELVWWFAPVAVVGLLVQIGLAVMMAWEARQMTGRSH